VSHKQANCQIIVRNAEIAWGVRKVPIRPVARDNRRNARLPNQKLQTGAHSAAVTNVRDFRLTNG
jgi:hypothetical protein